MRSTAPGPDAAGRRLLRRPPSARRLAAAARLVEEHRVRLLAEAEQLRAEAIARLDAAEQEAGALRRAADRYAEEVAARAARLRGQGDVGACSCRSGLRSATGPSRPDAAVPTARGDGERRESLFALKARERAAGREVEDRSDPSTP